MLNSPVIKIDHIAIVSRQESKIKRFFERIGIMKRWEGIVPEIEVNCQYFSFSNVDIEIVTPLNDSSIVSAHYKNYPNFPLHHIAFEVTSLDEELIAKFLGGQLARPYPTANSFHIAIVFNRCLSDIKHFVFRFCNHPNLRNVVVVYSNTISKYSQYVNDD